jgi:hypothetical protein
MDDSTVEVVGVATNRSMTPDQDVTPSVDVWVAAEANWAFEERVKSFPTHKEATPTKTNGNKIKKDTCPP